MLIIEQREENGVCNVSKVRNGKTIFFHIGISRTESNIVIRRFIRKYFKKIEAKQEAMDLLM